MKLKIFLLALIVIFPAVLIAQPNVHNNVVYSSIEEAREARRRDENNAAKKAIIDRANDPSQRIDDGLTPGGPLRPDIEGPLKVSREQKSLHADFLKEKNTGIFQIVPEENCSSTVSPTNPNPINPNSAYYSFEKKLHTFAGGDLGLKKGMFGTGFVNDTLGMIVALGDVPLDSVDLNSTDVQKINAVAIPKEKSAFRLLREKSNWSAPAKLNETYVMRSIQAGNSDLLVAFKLVEIKPNGNMIIIWKRLQKLDAPDVK